MPDFLWHCSPPSSSVHGDSPSKNPRVGCSALLQGIFPTQGSNPGIPHSKLILYHLSHQGSTRILEWVAYPFSRGTCRPRNQSGVSCIAGELPGKPFCNHIVEAIQQEKREGTDTCYISSVQLLSCIWLFVTPWTAWCQASLSITQLLELTQTHVHRDTEAIQPSHPLPSPSPPALNLSQNQGLFQRISSSHQVAKVLEFQLQHQSFKRIFRTDFL